MPQYTSLAIQDLDSFIYGTCPQPVALKNGMLIGGGTVYPELNFTLPNMLVDADSMAEVRAQYTQMISEACKRAVELNAPGLVVEFELLPDLTLVPEWGAEVTDILQDTLDEIQARHGLKTALRVTPNDIREFARPPIQRSGRVRGEHVPLLRAVRRGRGRFLLDRVDRRQGNPRRCDPERRPGAVGVRAGRAGQLAIWLISGRISSISAASTA